MLEAVLRWQVKAPPFSCGQCAARLDRKVQDEGMAEDRGAETGSEPVLDVAGALATVRLNGPRQHYRIEPSFVGLLSFNLFCLDS